MSKRIIRRSDGTWEVHETRGFFYYAWRGFLAVVIVAMAVHTWWMGPAILLILILGIIGRRMNGKD